MLFKPAVGAKQALRVRLFQDVNKLWINFSRIKTAAPARLICFLIENTGD